MKHLRIAAVLFGAATLLVLAACPNPIADLTVSQVSDRAAPIVTFGSPVEGSSYTQTVTVQGTAVDAGRLKEVAWAVTGTLGTLVSGTIAPSAIGPGGSFAFQFGTLDFSGPVAVTVQATDWNDNVGTAVRTLASPGSSLSSFAVDGGNGSVQMSWEPVAGATYTLYYTTNGSLPAQGYGQQRSLGDPPQSLGGLANGAMHVFLLKATAGGHDYWSDYVRAIPVAGTTLAPSTRGVLGAVHLEWKTIPATDQFEVLRSTARDSGFSNISGTLSGTSFTDTGVLPGVRYFYQVRPALAGADPSAPVAGESVPFPLDTERRVGYVMPPGNQVNDVAVHGTYAFAANQNNGFQVFDIADPSHPVYVTGVSTGTDNAMGIGVNPAGTIAYMSAGNFLYAFDITNPRAPQFIAKSVSLGDKGWGVTVRGNDIFVAASSAGAKKFLNGNLAAIDRTFNAIGAGGGGVYGIASDANYVYLAAETKTFVVYPVSFTLAGSMNATRAMGVAVATHGGTTYAYVSDETASTLRIFDVTNPLSIGTLGTLALAGILPRGISARWPAVALAGGITAGSAALQVVNVADPATPRLAFPVMLPSGAERVTISGDYAYVAEQGLGLQVANIASPATPIPQGSPVLSSANALAVDGDIAVATAFSTVLQVYDLSSPDSPQPLGPPYGTLSQVYAVVVRWPYAYLAETGKLEIVDLAPSLQSQAPTRAGWTAIIGNGNDIALSGDYALVADSGNCVDIVDVADPANPAVVGNFLTTGYVAAVGARGSYGYAVTLSSPQTFYIFSLVNPLQPSQIGSFAPSLGGGYVDSLTISGDYAYLSSRNGSGTGYGMAIVDVSDPAAPVLCNTGSLGFDGRFVEVVGDHALVLPLSGSTLRVYSLASRMNPRLIGTIAQGGTAIRASGSHAYIADWSGGRFTSLALWQ